MALSPLLSKYDNVLLDLDGCVWVGDSCTRGAPKAVSELRAAGKRLAFVTNDARRSPEEYVRKLWSLGLKASLEEVVTVGGAIQLVLAERGRGRGTYVIGSPAIFRHVADSGQSILNGTPRATEAEVVVVAGHDEFDFGELRDATQAVLAGAEMIAAGRDRTFPTDDGEWPGTGAIVAALEYATGTRGTKRRQARSADLLHRARSARRRDGRWSSATGWIPTLRALPPPGSTPRSC